MYYCILEDEEMTADPEAAGVFSATKAFHESIFLGDLDAVTSGTGKGVRSMLLQQAKSFGLPMWPRAIQDETIPLQPGEERPDDICSELLRQKHKLDSEDRKARIHVYCQTTDAGPDQIGCRNQIAKEIAPFLFILHLVSNCMCHQGHL